MNSTINQHFIKKLIFLFTVSIICLGYFSCSSENDVTIDNSKINNSAFRIADPDVATAKDLYIAMMATTEYSDLESSIADFNLKLKKANRGVNFETKSEWMGWIVDNIGTTGFNDKIEFEMMLDSLITKTENLLNSNKLLFTYMADADKDQLAIIVKPELEHDYNSIIGTVTTSSNCENN